MHSPVPFSVPVRLELRFVPSFLVVFELPFYRLFFHVLGGEHEVKDHVKTHEHKYGYVTHPLASELAADDGVHGKEDYYEPEHYVLKQMEQHVALAGEKVVFVPVVLG